MITDLLTGKWVHFSFDSYGRSDRKAALDFISSIQAGDLLIRDLGYACMASFKAIINADAVFINRLKSNYQVSLIWKVIESLLERLYSRAYV